MEKTPSDKLLDMIGKNLEPPAIMQRQPSKIMIDLTPMIKKQEQATKKLEAKQEILEEPVKK